MLVRGIIISIEVNVFGGEKLQSNRILEIAKNNNGTVTSKMVAEQNINRGVIMINAKQLKAIIKKRCKLLKKAKP